MCLKFEVKKFIELYYNSEHLYTCTICADDLFSVCDPRKPPPLPRKPTGVFDSTDEGDELFVQPGKLNWLVNFCIDLPTDVRELYPFHYEQLRRRWCGHPCSFNRSNGISKGGMLIM